MKFLDYKDYLNLYGKVAVVTGAGGVLCSEMSRGLASFGVSVAVLDVQANAAKRVATEITSCGGNAVPITCNVLEKNDVERAAKLVLNTFGRVDILINGAGGNKPEASTNLQQTFFDLPLDAFQWIFDLNVVGTLLPCQVFGRIMAQSKEGVILNISSMNYLRPLTRVPAYSAAKAAVSNLTQWLAVYMAQEYSPRIRVNAIAPGFFCTEQNRFLLFDQLSNELTPRGCEIIAHTPMGRFGETHDLLGTVLWLISPTSAFVTGIIVPVDGGFSAFSGV